jgi:predicted DNA binding CopG/RHH family protein
MTIVKRPTATTPATKAAEAAAERFIQAAPDGMQGNTAGSEENRGVQITLRINKDQLDRVTAAAKRQGIPRASYIKRAIALQLEADTLNRKEN